jgi:hypothetical protein
MLPCTPLVPSRSLGRLLGLERLWFKLEGGQPAGSWLDRGADLVVADAAGTRGLLATGSAPFGPALALHATRAGLAVHLFVAPEATDSPDVRWAAALGARVWRVACETAALEARLPDVAAASGWHSVGPEHPRLRETLHDLLAEASGQAGEVPEIVAISGLLSTEGCWLAAGDAPSLVVQGTLGAYAQAGELESAGPRLVLAPVSLREADAARRLLAREEGLIASRRGVAGLVGLIRARRNPADRRLSKLKSAIVLLANEVGGWEDGPPAALDEALVGEPITLDALCTDLRGALLRPPG